jgi:hypothetical protein
MMGKVEVSALIKAIQESVSLLVSDGIAPRERITDPVNDAARVQDLESGYSTEIDDIVDNIPDVPPTPPAPTSLTAYFNRNNPGVNSSLFGSNDGTTQYNRLYEKDGSGSTSEMSFDPSYTYTVLHVYEADGTEVLPSGGRFELGDSSNYLRLLFFNGGSSWVAAKIEYTKSSTEMTAYFNYGIKNNQKSVSSSWGPYGGTTELLYPLNSSQFVPYDSTKTYKVKTVFYVNGTNPVTITNDSVTIDDKNMNGNHTGHLIIHTHNPNPATGNVCGCTFTVE